MKTSKNDWETQPRKENGEFTFRVNPNVKSLIKYLLEESYKKDTSNVSTTSKGGSYYELSKTTKGNKSVEIHHMPANSISPLSRGKGPCIIMEKDDHKKTASFGNRYNAYNYRQRQKQLIEQGMFLNAELMDILNLLKLFGSKYAKSMLEKIEYDEKLESEGKIDE